MMSPGPFEHRQPVDVGLSCSAELILCPQPLADYPRTDLN